MVKLVLTLAFEVLIGVALGGTVLAVLVPVLSHFGLVSSDDMTGAFVISSVLVISVGLMIFRPGSALNRHFER